MKCPFRASYEAALKHEALQTTREDKRTAHRHVMYRYGLWVLESNQPEAITERSARAVLQCNVREKK